MNEATDQSPAKESTAQPAEKIWKFPRRGRVLRLKPKEVMPLEPIPTERETRLKEKYGIEPQTGLRERGVRFDYEDGPAWAVEAYIPISEEIRKVLKRETSGGIDIPKKITGITYLDLAPQESVYPASRRTIRTNLRTQSRYAARGSLDKLRTASTRDTISDFFGFLVFANMGYSPENKKAAVFADLFQNVFYDKKETQKKFNEVLAKGKGTDLLLVHGHGGFDPHMMGEQFPDTVMHGKNVAQRMGNRVPTKDIIERYNDPKTFSAIIFAACNLEGAKIDVKDVPIVHPMGVSGPFEHPLASWIPSFKNQAFVKDVNEK